MKKFNINNLKYILILGLSFGMLSCEFEDQVDPNNPSLQQYDQDATVNELNNLIVGIESEMRSGYPLYVTATGTIARELYLFDADPRNTEDLLGKNGAVLDNNTFYLTSPYNNSYQNVKNTNILLDALDNTALVSETEKSGYRGFANTVQALQLLRVLNMLDENGIRVDIKDPDNLGPFVSKSAALEFISGLLNTGFTQLGNAGSAFPFELSSGFEGFNTPSTFAQFNRALAARVAIYREEWGAVLGLLTDSFFDPNGDLTVGPKHSFSTASGDQLNGLFKIPGNNGDMIVVHDRFLSNAERISNPNDDTDTIDQRIVWKMAKRAENAPSKDGLNGKLETALYPTPTSPIDIIRNEELVLISAEAKLQTGDITGAISDLNIIRDYAGLDPYSGAQTADAVTDELLTQRQYSLWCEGHTMVDLRRYGRLNANNLPIDREGDQVFTQFPIPLTEAE
ncbi:RagB/SusD family nutrient uptake outer membrane protein [Marivirga arenosa]|uniref:RagB/SusD family nutrient uptake outer membrane protein n=1 Tax=Marivirga arenosa TaxID=3059076 RepID=A0AA49GEP1_9BACT|nr:RagB/SusD family nutrient uptake outer membrane protein [Marivirga sp. ABR2-2]WKK86777.2 RagB/SusD family nutrient uptake outer membrane protein [Marivirga sp. ABR2-2]